MKKILIVHNYTEDSLSAMSFHLANELSAKGHQVLFLSNRPYHTEPKRINENLLVHCWSSHLRPTSRPGDIWLFTRLYFSFRPDIVITHFAGSNLACVLSKLYSLGRTRTYEYYHTLSSQIETDMVGTGNATLQRLRFRLLSWRKRLYFRLFCDHVLATSHLAYTDFMNYYKLKIGMEHITPLADRFTGLKMDLRGTLRIAYLGRLDQSKGIDILLDAVRELKHRYGSDIHFEFAGRGLYEKELHAMQDEGLVEFIGYLNYVDVDPFLHRNHIFIVPSLFDNLVTVGIETIMKERCLIISKHTGLTDYLTDGKDCIKIEPDTAAIVGAVEQLMENREEIRRIAEGGRKTFEEKFSISSYLNFMNGLLPLQ